jgi:hypothetical protein
MALDNLISVVFSEEELKKIDDALAIIENVLNDKAIGLSPEERQRFGRVADGTEPWLGKVNGHMTQSPKFNPEFIDIPEFTRDLASRVSINSRLARVNNINTLLQDTNVLLGADLYHGSIAYYRNIKLLSKQNVPGAKAIYDDLSMQFPGRPKSVKNKTVGQ